jgi:hypothetical protein
LSASAEVFRTSESNGFALGFVSISVRSTLLAIACLILESLAALGQPIIGNEIVSAPLPPRNELAGVGAPAIAMARDRRGTAIAWTARNNSLTDTIYVARLDETGGIIGAAREVPTFSPSQIVDANAPSLAVSPSGNGFTLGWIEISLAPSPFSRVVYCQLDPNLNASLPQLLVTSPPDATDSPVIVRSGKSNWITTAGVVWQVGPDGSLGVPIQSGMTANDMVASTGYPLLVGTQVLQSPNFTSCNPNCPGNYWLYCAPACRIYQYTPVLQLVWLNTSSGESTLSSDNAQPAVGSDGRTVVVAWYNGDQTSGGLVIAARLDLTSVADFGRVPRDELVLGTFAPGLGRTRPDIATDGERYVIVWRTPTPRGDYDIVGASIDRAGNVMNLAIATSSADERDPSVLAINQGRFLIAYDKNSGGERRLAGRFLDFPTRHRVVQ